jgi:hypothetical protein
MRMLTVRQLQVLTGLASKRLRVKIPPLRRYTAIGEDSRLVVADKSRKERVYHGRVK